MPSAPNRKSSTVIRQFLTALLWAALSSLASAHPANVASAQFKVTPDGKYTARLRFDLAAFATNAAPKDADDKAMNAFLDGSDDAIKSQLADAEARFRDGFVAETGGVTDHLTFPTVADIRRFLATNPNPRLPAMMTVDLDGHLPPGARTVAFRYPAIIDTVIQTVEFPYTEPISEPVESNRASTTLSIPTAEAVKRLADAMNAPRTVAPPVKTPTKPIPAKPTAPKPTTVPSTVNRQSSIGNPLLAPPNAPKTPTATLHNPRATSPSPPPVNRQSSTVNPLPSALPPIVNRQSSIVNSVFTYLRLGFHHILPEGVDHILFVLGLFLLGSNSKALIKQITAFTVAHSITLALATLNIVRLPGAIIEPVIALSIAFVAIENLFLKDVKPWRTAVVFLFGLVHGMGFAEVFKDAGLTGSGLLTALVSFNVGVELGQLTVVAAALLAIGWFRKDPRYRQYVVVPCSLLIAATALFWTFERIFG